MIPFRTGSSTEKRREFVYFFIFLRQSRAFWFISLFLAHASSFGHGKPAHSEQFASPFSMQHLRISQSGFLSFAGSPLHPPHFPDFMAGHILQSLPHAAIPPLFLPLMQPFSPTPIAHAAPHAAKDLRKSLLFMLVLLGLKMLFYVYTPGKHHRPGAETIISI